MKQHPKVEAIIFPFDKSFPQYQLAKQQMSGACGLFTFVIKTDSMDDIIRFCESLRHIMMAVSWGRHESLVMPKCAGIQPADFDPVNRSIVMYACMWAWKSRAILSQTCNRRWIR
ncbi:MAG: PLP-dependent transferase [Bacteroidota bacterium]